jgi:hypothetical protein
LPTKYRRRASIVIGGKFRVGIPWFEPQEYARILEIMNYPADMSRDYERWRELAENRQRGRKGQKLFVVRVVVHPEEFVAWCTAKAIQPDGGALNTFVNERATGHNAS